MRKGRQSQHGRLQWGFRPTRSAIPGSAREAAPVGMPAKVTKTNQYCLISILSKGIWYLSAASFKTSL